MGAVLEMGWKPSLLQKRKSRPPLGLRNLGNTCYLNSVLQCLTYTPPLANLCLRNHHSSLCQKLDSGGKRECPFCILEKRIARSLNLDAQHDAPSKIGSSIRLFAEHFQWGRQEDAHEFLRYVIDACHNTCLKLLKTTGSAISNGSATAIESASSNGNTVVKDIFGGSLISQLKCLSCGNESKKTDEMMDISLDLFQSNTLKDALRRFFQPEVLDGENKYNCTMCKKLSAARKQMFILHAPNVLVIQLKRFEGIHGGKINRDIAFEEVLFLSGFMSKASQDPNPEYNLFGSIVHSGYSPESGHYYAYIKDPAGRWFCCNDAYVSLSTSKEVLSEKVYILFYLRGNQKPKPGKSVPHFEANCPNSNGNMTSQIQKTTIVSKPPKLIQSGEFLSEINVSNGSKTSKVSSGLQIKLQNVRNLEKKYDTSANGGTICGNRSTTVTNNKKLSEPMSSEELFTNSCKETSQLTDVLHTENCVSAVDATIDFSENHCKEILTNGNGCISPRKEENYGHSDDHKALALANASKSNSDASKHKRKSCGTSEIPLPNGLKVTNCSKSDDQHSAGELEKIKKLLVQRASSELRNCGWASNVYSFMHTRKKLCSKAAGSPDPAELRKMLIADAKRIFILELPETLKENLIQQLKSFSKGKTSLDD